MLALFTAAFVSRRYSANSENDTAPHDVQIMFIGPGKPAVLRRILVWSFDVAQVLAFCIEDLHACRRRRVGVFLAVDAQAVCPTDESIFRFLLEVVFAEITAILQRSVGLHVIREKIFSAPIVDIKRLLVRTQRDSVRPG